MARSLHFDASLDPELLASVEAAARAFGPYRVELISGYRPGDPRQHGKGRAVDFALYDPKTGAKLDNYQAGGAVGPYQQFANFWYSQLSPEQQQKARWGGYFGDPSKPGYGKKYGEQDYMHLDLGRSPTLGMLAGDWGTGFKPEAMQALGLQSAGGLGEASAAAPAATSQDAVMRAFLDTLSGTESPGYDVLYGGGKFTDYSQHPNAKIPIMSGPNKGDYSSAAGRYQFINDTWTRQAQKLGLKDFSPASQDAAAWDLAATTYRDATGGDLVEALSSGDPGRINAAAQVLNTQWTSLPGGIEQAARYGPKTFADVYGQALAGSGAGSSPAVVTSEAPAPASPSTAAAPTTTEGTLAEIGKAISKNVAPALGAYGGGGTMPTGPKPPAPPVNAQTMPQTSIEQAQQQADQRRQQLAMMLQRLNTGSLV